MILSLETSTNVCSVAIHEIENGHLINHLESHLDKAHSAWLTLLIEQAVKFSGRNMQDIQAVAVSAGPGSYTGLRIGVSVAKGICYGLEIPLLSVNPLEAMTHEVTAYFTDSRFVYCPMLDARRMEVYTACYTH
ncbi:MAG: tRNA (adenosine(37)-N6)-threonylcarbamoyltransferase complex dimerization subunit type 1 TsaB, partial [Flammeovirgaceae bacterium]|nr:tRNA (adenosine(37)-N6)-threonylcarbamoyltransferase complex dimerization subunit type 1 TsaB [Flammeovirgaceae bacterium]MDW8288831.1 tRNA (adenosine(37)-N6)-threonylcarbamoyltransferase complex dimerization subunit type 1 TsaB [Flammeovirgaceae bacterium]